MYCKTVWNGIFILPDGYIRVCSLGRYADPALDFQRARDKHGNPMHILTHDISEIVNSDKHREIRLLNKHNPEAWSPHCDCCEIREKITDISNKNTSRRIFLKKIDSEHVDENKPLEKIDEYGNTSMMPISLDVNFGNLCNLKCIMCNPDFSNQWYNEWFDYWQNNEIGQSKKIKVDFDDKRKKWITPVEYKWHESPIWWKKFEEMMPHLRHIYVTGGEPMLTPSHDEMLKRLIDSGMSNNIILEYDTNATAINTKLTDMWEKFKKVHLRISMDATVSLYELIRYPGKWDIFDKNVKNLKYMMIQSKNKIFLSSLTSCFQLSNCFDQQASSEYAASLAIPYHIRFLEGPMYMSTESLNVESKMDLISYYKKNISEKSEIIINYLNARINTSRPDRIQEYIKFMNYLDISRKTDWKKDIPNVYNMIKNNYNFNI